MKKLIPFLFLTACYTGPIQPTPPDPITPDLILLKGETSEIRVASGCPTLTPPAGLSIELFEYKSVTTTHPSYIGATIGAQKDALVPCVIGLEGAWIDVTAARDATPGVYKLGAYNVLVLNAALPTQPTMPFYGEIVSATVWQLENIPDDGQHNMQKAQAIKDWSTFLRKHRIEPIKQWIKTYSPSNLESDPAPGADFLSVIVKDAIAPPMLVRYESTSTPSVASLQALEAAIQSGKIPSSAWGYVRDEGQLGPDGKTSQPNLAALLQKSALYRQYAPSMKQYSTWVEIPELAPLDGTWPVAEWFLDPRFTVPYTKPYGLYVGCMSQGRCAPGPASNPTGTPLMVLDSPEIHQMIFPVMAYALGAQRAMYYRLDKKIKTAFQLDGQYDEGGHGDGTMLYYQGGPQASARLKAIRYGSNSVEYLKLLGEDGHDLVQDTRHWIKDKTLLNNLRNKLAKKLGAI